MNDMKHLVVTPRDIQWCAMTHSTMHHKTFNGALGFNKCDILQEISKLLSIILQINT